MLDLTGKVIVVIGGTSGLGLSAAKAFARCGAKLVLVGRSEEKLKAELHLATTPIEGFSGDAADPATAERAIALALERFESFDGLYHVAGGSGRKFGDGPLHEITDAGV